MPTPAIQTLVNDAQQVLNLDSISAVRSVVAVSLANANTGTPLNPNLTTQQLWNEFYQVVTKSKSDIESIIANQLMKFLYSPPAPGGVGANGQVIFNNNGVLAGDNELFYNATTNTLTTEKLIVPGNTQVATAGTLYVGTILNPKLKVDVAGTGVTTITEATITGDLNVSGNGAFTGTGYAALQRALIPVGENGVTSLDFRWYSTGTTYTTGARVHSSSDAAWTASSTPARLMFSTVPSGSTSLSERYRIDNNGIHTWSNVGGVAGTAMTLNSTGLGVGDVATVSRLQVRGSTSDSTSHVFYGRNSGGNAIMFMRNDGRFIVGNGTVDNLIVTETGNVGIGVTPSAWVSSSKAIDIAAWAGVGYIASSAATVITNNTYKDASSNWVFKNGSNAAGYFEISQNLYRWWQAPAAGGAGTTATMTQAMTLDASGSLILGAAAVATTATDGFLYIPSCAGAPTGVPTAKTGRVPMVVDSTNNRFYVYVSGAWKFAALI